MRSSTRAKTLHDVSVWSNSDNSVANRDNNAVGEDDTKMLAKKLLEMLKSKKLRRQQQQQQQQSVEGTAATTAVETTSGPKFEVFVDPKNPSKVICKLAKFFADPRLYGIFFKSRSWWLIRPFRRR